jgi:hypothetical protein
MYFIFGYNDTTAFNIDKIANEAMAMFFEEGIIANYVATDYENEFASWGDTLRIPYPAEMDADRTPEGTAAGVTALDSSYHDLKLNQRLTLGFTIGTREQQRSFQNLAETYLRPTMRGLAKLRDRVIQGEVYKSYGNTAGALGAALTFDDIINAGTIMTENHVPTMGRNAIVGPRMGGYIRKMDEFIANVSSTDDTVIRTGLIGDINGFAVHETSSFVTVAQSTRVTGAVNSASMVAGTTAVIVDSFSAAITSGSWCTIAGVPYRITSTVGGATPTTLNIEGGLRDDVADNAVVYVYTPSVVNHPTAGNYAAGYEGWIGWDGAVTPKVGQGVTFGTDGLPYSIVRIDGGNILLNRPLDVAVNNDASIFLMPGGNYGVALSKNSIQIANRPLAIPGEGEGVRASVVDGGGWSIRVMSEYDMYKAETTYMFDFIMGAKSLQPALNVIFLG